MTSRAVGPPCLHPISHQVAPKVEGVEICPEHQRHLAGNILCYPLSSLLGTWVSQELYIWNGKKFTRKVPLISSYSDTCNWSWKASPPPVLYFLHNLSLLLLWHLAPAAVFITVSPRANPSRTEACVTHCYGLNYVSLPPNSYIEALTPRVTVFEDRTSKEVIKVKWGHKNEALIQ